MAAEIFNSISGYSVGIPPVQIADSTGNVVTNLNAPAANVTANTVYANTYRYANGVIFSANAGGDNTQLQFNNNGAFAGIPNVTWNGSILSLGNVSDVKIDGGENGFFLQTDGSGGLTWSPAQSGNGSNGTPGGANSQVQFNDAGDFGGDAGFTYDKVTNVLTVDTISTVISNVSTVNANTVNANTFIGNGSQLTGIVPNTANFVIQPNQSNITSVGTLTELTVSGNANFSVSNLKISGGLTGYVLTTDGTGNVSWELPNAGAGNPGGANTSIQFNNNGNFAGTTAFTFNNVSNAVNLTGNLTIRNLNANNATFLESVNIGGNLSASFLFGDGSFLTNVQADVANTVAVSSQPNITSVGTLINLSASGNIVTSQTVSASAFQTSGNANVGTLRVSNTVTITGALSANGNVNFSSSANIDLGSVANIRISGGLNGYVLSTDGLGILSWVPQGGGGGGGGAPGGANTQIQYNKNNEFAGNAFFTYNDVTNTVQIGGLMIANTFQVGSGAYKFGTSAVFFAVTASPVKQVLYSIPVSEVSGVDFEIIGTDSVGQKRQSVKISSIYFAGIVQYNEYAGLYVNGGVGSFAVEYNPGDVLTPPSLDLTVTPDSSNNTVYKMLITKLAP